MMRKGWVKTWTSKGRVDKKEEVSALESAAVMCITDL